MKLTPLPFTVRAQIIAGCPFTVRAQARASRICVKSWPSISFTAHPNARHLSGTGLMFMTFFTSPSICRPLRSWKTQRLSSL